VKSNVAVWCGVVAAAGLVGAGLSGCSAKVETSSETKVEKSVSAAELQTNLTERLTAAGSPPQSVTCKSDLVGEVGKTSRCDVVFSDTNSLQAIVTTTGNDSSGITYDLIPAMTKEQVEKAVAGLSSAQSAKCDAGLDGKVGNTTNCEVTLDGQTSKRIVEVSTVDPANLGIELSAFMLLPKQQVQEVLMQKLAADGTPVETVECVGDVSAEVGSVIECVAVTGNDQQGYDVTVVESEGDTPDFDYKAKP
jgi:hypothetical protein